jgi:hypothetical protein
VQSDSIDNEPSPRRRPVRTWLIVETILGLPAIAITGFMALMSPMMFDAPGSTENPAVVLLFASMVGLPLSLVVGLLVGWIAIALKRDRAALWFSLLPLLPILAAVVAILWLQAGHDGQFGK